MAQIINRTQRGLSSPLVLVYNFIVQGWFQGFLLAWIPLFVAIDPIGLAPFFIGITRNVPIERIEGISRQAALTAALVSVGFMFLGRAIFHALGITVADFQVAGGLILLILSAKDLLWTSSPPSPLDEQMGVVPLGMPLIAGPATLAALLLLADTVGISQTLVALFLNIGLVFLSFRYCHKLAAWVGLRGLIAFSKVTSLLLAAIAVHMIRMGMSGF